MRLIARVGQVYLGFTISHARKSGKSEFDAYRRYAIQSGTRNFCTDQFGFGGIAPPFTPKTKKILQEPNQLAARALIVLLVCTAQLRPGVQNYFCDYPRNLVLILRNCTLRQEKK